MSETTQEALEALFAFWEDAGVETAEARLALAAPAPRAASAAREQAPRKLPPVGHGGGDVEAARAANTLEEVRAALLASGGAGLKATARNLVFVAGRLDAPVVVVGEKPGREEDEAGAPFVGVSGRLLDAMLGSIGLSRDDNVLITNAVFWRPPGDRPPTQAEISACLPYCERIISLVQPRFVLAVGGVAAQALFRSEHGVMRLRGKALRYASPEGVEIPASALLHTAYLLRRPQDKALAWADLQAIEARLKADGVV